MTAPPRRSAAGSVALLLCTAFLLSSSSSTTSASSCAVLRQWAEAYRGTSPTLQQLARLDRGHRLAVFNAVSPSVRSQLWREQLEQFESDAALSPSARALVREGRNLLTPQYYAHDRASTDAVRQFWSRAAASFERPAQRRAWFELGSVLAPPTRSVAVVDFCDCRRGGIDCAGDCAASPCTPWQGCGIGGGAECNGICQSAAITSRLEPRPE
jgi:hypothetical protein